MAYCPSAALLLPWLVDARAQHSHRPRLIAR